MCGFADAFSGRPGAFLLSEDPTRSLLRDPGFPAFAARVPNPCVALVTLQQINHGGVLGALCNVHGRPALVIWQVQVSTMGE